MLMSSLRRVPAEAQRVLITSHDAFRYLGARLRPGGARAARHLDRSSEAGTARRAGSGGLRDGAPHPGVCLPKRRCRRGACEAVREAVQAAAAFEVTVGGALYGDALGDAGTPTGTYAGAVRHNVDTIVDGLAARPATAAAR